MRRVLNYIDRLEKATLVWMILGLAFIGFIQVFSRYLLNYSFTWFEELGRYLGVFVAFLGGGLGVKYGLHFTMDLVVVSLNRPWNQVLRVFSNVLSGFLFVVVTYYSWKIVIKMYGYGTTSPAMGIPMYLAYLPIAVFSVVMGFRFFKAAFDALAELFGHAPRASREATP